jgi:hypothetical protein
MRAARCASAISMTIAGAAVIFVWAAAGAWAQTKESTEQKTGAVDRGVAATTRKEQPPVSIRVTLSVYSGRPNPSWTVEPGPDLDRLVGLIQSLKPTDAKLFDYDEWNRLGYASFWLSARGIAGVPSEVHVWRDMAFVPSKEGKGMQAIGASKLYEALVTQAEGNGQQEFFVNYRKLPPTKRGAQ